MALYGPLLDRYGRDKGQYKDKEYHVTPEGGLLTGPQLVLALAERGKNWQLQIHRDRRREYADVLNRLEEYQSHVDRHRRDLGYESPHHDG